jgi:hypothetical protein
MSALLQIQRCNSCETCNVVWDLPSQSDGRFIIARGLDGHEFIATLRGGRWLELPLTDIIANLMHYQELKRGLISEMVQEAQRLNLP